MAVLDEGGGRRVMEGRSHSLLQLLTPPRPLKGPWAKLFAISTLNSECSPSPSRQPRGRSHTQMYMKAISVELGQETLRTKKRGAHFTQR